jgi:MATE family multidrug resistance protein
MRYGFPNGIRFAIEVSAWTAFLFFVGRLGKLELTATNIAWRIEGFAFFPVIGVAQAVAILVGNAQGKEDPSESMRVTRRGLAMSQIWVASVALLFVLLPRELFGLFYSPDSMTAEFFDSLVSLGSVLLRFVALYCLLDAFNIVILSALQAAGDTRWTLWAALAAHAVFLGALVWADIAHWGMYAEWGIATAFVCAQALMWLGRLLSGRWKHIRVIDGF